MILESRQMTEPCLVLTPKASTTLLQVRSLDIRVRVTTRKEGQETFTTHLERWWDTLHSSHTTITSMEIRDSSTLWSRSIKLNSANISSKTIGALSLNIVSLLMVKKILDRQMIHSQRILVRQHWVQCTQITRRFHASSGGRPVSASLERAVPSTTARMRREGSLIHFQTYLRESLYHLCLKNLKRLATIINIRIIITATTTREIIPLISMETTISSTFHLISTWATILASKIQWSK